MVWLVEHKDALPKAYAMYASHVKEHAITMAWPWKEHTLDVIAN